MTTPTASSTEELQRMQDLIQDTSGGTDSDEDGDVDEETVNAKSVPTLGLRNCAPPATRKARGTFKKM